MSKYLNLPGAILLASLLFSCGGNDENNPAPPPDWQNWYTSRTFTENGESYAPADFEKMNLDLRFLVTEFVAHGFAQIEFHATTDGFAYFLSEAPVSTALLNGNPVQITTRLDPDKLNQLHVIQKPLRKGELYRLQVNYKLPTRRVSFQNGGANFLTSMADIGKGNFFEAYAPSSFEYDAFSLKMSLALEGGKAPLPAHSLFANGTAKAGSGGTTWEVEFPPYFTASSFYLHLTNTPLIVFTSAYQGKNKLIPITVYSKDKELATRAIALLPGLFQELELTYGPYAHGSFIAYISGSGGMEYGGATITSISALGHELTHSWFARGVIPSDGRSGWIDEAIASWRDNEYFRATQLGWRLPTNLGRISAFQRFTVSNSYVDGRNLLSELDLILAGQGGLRPVLRDFYETWKRKSIRTADFRFFLEEKSGMNFGDLFQKYVYADTSFTGDSASTDSVFPEGQTLHPPPLTDEEIESLR